jgi:predicted HTH transcriptional regulator
LFFLRSLQTQKRTLEAKVEREKLMRAGLSALAVAIVELVADRGRSSISEIVLGTGGNRSTIKKRIQELVKAGILVRSGKGRATWYTLA